jgi:hypothetical protein
MTDPACRNCGRALTGPYCAHCGQAERDSHPPTVAHFFHDAIHEFLHVDGKIFLTLAALFCEPGKLTAEYRAGRVASWVRPLRIFLIVIALQALISSGQGPLNHQVSVSHRSTGDLSVKIADDLRLFEDKEEHTPASDEELREFDHQFARVYGVVRYSSVAVFALVAWLLYRRKQPYFVSHLIAGLHFYSFWYALALVASIPARMNPAWKSLTALSAVYLFLMLRRLFHERWYWTLLKTIALYTLVYTTELGLGYAVVRWIEA